MSFASACESWDADNKERVYRQTWGHLAPVKNLIYRGRFVCAVGCFGSDGLNPVVINCDFKGLDDSPWFHESLNDFVSDSFSRQEGKVFEWVGTFKNYEWKGAYKVVYDAKLK